MAWLTPEKPLIDVLLLRYTHNPQSSKAEDINTLVVSVVKTLIPMILFYMLCDSAGHG